MSTGAEFTELSDEGSFLTQILIIIKSPAQLLCMEQRLCFPQALVIALLAPAGKFFSVGTKTLQTSVGPYLLGKNAGRVFYLKG